MLVLGFPDKFVCRYLSKSCFKGTHREWVFKNEEQTRQLRHQSQLTWLANVKILSPLEFKIVERNTVGKGQSESAHLLKRNLKKMENKGAEKTTVFLYVSGTKIHL